MRWRRASQDSRQEEPIGIKLAPGCAGRVCHAWRETCRNPNKCTNATIKRAKGPLAQTESAPQPHIQRPSLASIGWFPNAFTLFSFRRPLLQVIYIAIIYVLYSFCELEPLVDGHCHGRFGLCTPTLAIDERVSVYRQQSMSSAPSSLRTERWKAPEHPKQDRAATMDARQ